MWDEAEQYYIRHFNLCIKNVQLAHVRLFIGCDYVEKDLSRIDTPRAIYACTASEYAIKIIWRIFSARSKNNFDFCCCCCLISLYVQRWKKIFHSWIFVVVGYGVCWGIFHYARVNKCRTCMMQCLYPMVTHNLNNKILLIDWFVVFYFFLYFLWICCVTKFMMMFAVRYVQIFLETFLGQLLGGIDAKDVYAYAGECTCPSIGQE